MLKCLKHQGSDFYRYMASFATAWEGADGEVVLDRSVPRRLRAILGRCFGFRIGSWRGRLIVCASFRLESVSWPWCYFHEIVPMMWDLWPQNYPAFRRFVRRHHVRTVFCTARQSVAWVNVSCPGVQAHWVPEGVDVNSYPCGPRLAWRSADVLSFGRRKGTVHEVLLAGSKAGSFSYQTEIGRRFDDLTAAIRNARLTVCYPKCDTSPEESGGVETLTQRYWEAMLSGSLLIGRAPQELIDVCGYNPVIELGVDPVGQVKDILAHIEDYQQLADCNRATAEKVSGWENRVDEIRRILGSVD